MCIGSPVGRQEDDRVGGRSSEISPVPELLFRLDEPYDPDEGPFDRYRERSRWMVQQLQAVGVIVDARKLQKRMYQGECRAETLGMSLEEKRRWLRGRWEDLVTGECPDPVEELPERIQVVDELCREMGEDPSSWAERIVGERGTTAQETPILGVGYSPPGEEAAAEGRGE